ncbi:MAG: S-layer homology domain-containing protein [Bacillota bacterium]
MIKKLITVNLILFIVIAFTIPTFAYQPQDVDNNHWALPYISQLLDQDIMYIYRDGNFYPNTAITRGEFAYSLAKTLDLESSTTTNMTDITNHPAQGYISALVQEEIITGYPDHTFRPNKEITRAEIITMLARSLNLEDQQNKIKITKNSYSDLDSEHWAQELISLSSKLNIINGYPDGTFKPNNYVTRAESAKLLVKLRNFTPVTGTVVETYPLSKKVKINVGDDKQTFDLGPNPLIGRNNQLVELDEMLVSDTAYLLLNQHQEVIYFKAYGLVTKKDVAQEVSEQTNDFFNPDQLIEIADGNWEAVTPTLKEKVAVQLFETGLNPREVNALFNQNWDEMKELSKARLVEAVAIASNIPQEIITASLNKDWDKAKELAKDNAITTALNALMRNSSLLS